MKQVKEKKFLAFRRKRITIKLRRISDKQRKNWRLIDDGIGVHWEELDEDISINGLLN